TFRDLNQIFIGSSGQHPPSHLFETGPGKILPYGKPSQLKDDASVQGVFIWEDSSTGVWSIETASGTGAVVAGALIDSESSLSNLSFFQMELNNVPQFPNIMLKNNGSGFYLDVTRSTNTGDPSNSRTAVWADLDNDGDLDLFVVNAGFNGPGKQPDICYINE